MQAQAGRTHRRDCRPHNVRSSKDSKPTMVRRHYPHSLLPDVVVQVDAADRLGTFDQLGTEAVKSSAMARIRWDLFEALRRTSLVPPTAMHRKSVAGSQSPSTIITSSSVSLGDLHTNQIRFFSISERLRSLLMLSKRGC